MVLAFVRVMVRNPSWLVCSVALGSVPSVAGETTEDSLPLQGLIHPASAQGDDRHGLISGREWQTSVNKRQTFKILLEAFQPVRFLISFPTLRGKVVRKPQAPSSPWRSSGAGESCFFRKSQDQVGSRHTHPDWGISLQGR